MTDGRSFLSVQHEEKDTIENVIENWKRTLIVEKLDIESKIFHLFKEKDNKT